MSLLTQASLIVTPNGYKEGKLYSVIPSDGSGDLSVTRATTATRVNSAGLVELVPYNFMLDSETTWITNSVSITSGITDPNGGTNAYRVTDIAIGNVTDYVRKSFNPMPLTTGSIITFSIFMKGSGTIATYIERSISGPSFFSTKLHTLTSEYQRFTHTYTVPVDAEGFSVYVGNLTGTTATSVDIAFPQVVFGTLAKDYQKTETRLNIPRLDYSNGTCPSILVEPQRTNLLAYSEQFDSAAWQKENASVSANTTTSPDGTQNADSLIENGANDNHLIYQGGTLSAASYSASVFVKKNTRQYAFLQIATDGAANRYTIVVDLNNGTMTASSTSGSPSGTSYKIDSMGDGWYRLSVTATHTSAQVYSVFGLSNSATPTFNSLAIPIYSGDGTSSAYFYGAQLEAGSYATSYIPTTSASVTRNADVISKTGISSLIGQTEGTLFLDLNFKTPSGTTEGQIAITDNAGDNRVIIWNNFSLNTLGLQIKANGTNAINNVSLGSFVDGTRYKIAVAYKSGDTSVYVNGTQVISNTATFSFVSSLTDFILGGYYLPYNGHQLANASALWKTRLTNEELERLTGTGFNTYAEMANYYNYTLQ